MRGLRKKTALLALSGMALALTACVSPASRGAPLTPAPGLVRPIADILVSGPEFTVLTPDSVTVRAETRLPVVCAVVYGATPDYGQIATDTDMAGGGHSDHHPVITGLQPDTLYYARLQGVGPDGTLYRSEEYTFRTLPAQASAAGDEINLASPDVGARIVAVIPPSLPPIGGEAEGGMGGGADDSSFGALNAVDGNPATQWSSDSNGDEAWIEIELTAETQVTRIGFWTRTMGSSAQIQSFQIVTDQGEIIGPFDLPDAAQTFYFDTDFTARRLRFEAVSTSGGNTGAVEIEVYGEQQ